MVTVVVAHSLPELTGSLQHWSRLVRPVRRRGIGRLGAALRRVPVGVFAAAIAFSSVAQPVGQQDVVALLADGNPTPRWAQRLVASENDSVQVQSFAFADTKSRARVAISDGAAATPLVGYAPPEADGPIPGGRIARQTKGERLITVAARTAPGEMSAGSLIHAASFVAGEGGADLPRVAFVKLNPVSEARARTLLAKQTTDADSNDPAAFRARVLISQAAAATGASLAAAYATQGSVDVEAPFRQLFGDTGLDAGEDQEVTDEELAVDPHAWVGTPLPASVVTNSEQRCLAEAVYFEARGEPYNGQVAVAQVVLNRVRNPAYPNTICGVVYQNRQWRNRCQFSFACDLVADRVTDRAGWNQAQEIARETTAGRLKIPGLEAVTHYHATYVRPRWAQSMEKQKKIGLHIFYSTYGGGWS